MNDDDDYDDGDGEDGDDDSGDGDDQHAGKEKNDRRNSGGTLRQKLYLIDS